MRDDSTTSFAETLQGDEQATAHGCMNANASKKWEVGRSGRASLPKWLATCAVLGCTANLRCIAILGEGDPFSDREPLLISFRERHTAFRPVLMVNPQVCESSRDLSGAIIFDS